FANGQLICPPRLNARLAMCPAARAAATPALKNTRIRRIASAALFLASHAEAQPQNALDLLPVPTFVQLGVGRLTVDNFFPMRSQELGMQCWRAEYIDLLPNFPAKRECSSNNKRSTRPVRLY